MTLVWSTAVCMKKMRKLRVKGRWWGFTSAKRRGRNRAAGSCFLKSWLSFPLWSLKAGCSSHCSHRRDGQVGRMFGSSIFILIWCSLGICCLSVGFLLGPSCFSEKTFLFLSASLFPPVPKYSFVQWVTGWRCPHPVQPRGYTPYLCHFLVRLFSFHNVSFSFKTL